MIEHPNAIPIAVVTAVIIFVARELLEAFRRWRSNARKLHAIRRFLAAECERNNFSINRLLTQLSEIDEALKNRRLIEITNRQAATPRLVIHTNNGGEGSSPVPQIHIRALDKYLFDAASLDAGLFERVEATLDALIDAAHVRACPRRRQGSAGHVVAETCDQGGMGISSASPASFLFRNPYHSHL